MNARHILPADTVVTATGYRNAIPLPTDVINEHFPEKLREGSRARKVLGGTMSTAWRQYDCNFRPRQQRLKEIQGYASVLIFSWLGTLLLWGFLWWAAFRLLCCTVQLVRYVPGLLP